MKKVRYKVSIKQTTPEPQVILVSGLLDTIEHGKKRFQLNLQNGETVRGKIEEETTKVEQLRRYWGQSVTIKGVLHYKASGKPRFLEAQMIEEAQPGDGIFETLPIHQTSAQIWAQVKAETAGRDLAAEVWGKWPGDETIEQLLDMLKSSEN